MKPLDLQSERYQPTGNVASTGILNQLGRPSLDLLTVLVRETVQNSWDARLPGSESLRYSLNGWRLTHAQRQTLQTLVFPLAPANLQLAAALTGADDFTVLAVSDRGTSGLGGPTRADIVTAATEPRDFVDFLRNVGQPPDKVFNGGTYGYGKAAVYLASQVRTICVYTRCRYEGRTESRFIATALGPQYSIAEQGPQHGYYTGRHWWGRSEVGVAEPLRGSEADELARMLGLPGFAAGERGTTILILQPVFGDQSAAQAFNTMALALVWNFWPKMLSSATGHPAMTFQLAWEGTPTHVPDPRAFPPLEGFVAAMEQLKTGRTDLFGEVSPVAAQRPRKHLGRLALHKFPVRPRERLETGSEEYPNPVGRLSHHVALMRQAELVVKYVSGPALPTDQLEYAGVFLADADVDAVFAKAEPPTHDDWVPAALQKRDEKTFVNVALREINAAMDRFALPARAATPAESVGGVPLGQFADAMGSLLPAIAGTGARLIPVATAQVERITGSRETGISAAASLAENPASYNPIRQATDNISAESSLPSQGERPSRRTKARLIVHGTSELGLADDQPILITKFSVEPASGTAGTTVSLTAGAVLDGGDLEMEPPAGRRSPVVVGWQAPDGSRQAGGRELFIPADKSGPWLVAVTVPDGVMIGVILDIMEAR